MVYNNLTIESKIATELIGQVSQLTEKFKHQTNWVHMSMCTWTYVY